MKDTKPTKIELKDALRQELRCKARLELHLQDCTALQVRPEEDIKDAIRLTEVLIYSLEQCIKNDQEN